MDSAIGALRRVLRPLPTDVQRETLEYVRAIADVTPEIEASAGVEYGPGRREDFLFIAGIRWLWKMLEGQEKLMDATFSLLRSTDIEPSVRMGSATLSAQGPEHRELRRLRGQFRDLLIELEIRDLVTSGSLGELAELLDGRS